MCSKIIALACFIVCAQAVPLEQQYHQATSFASFNQEHNTIHHIQSAPVLKAAVAAVPVVHAAPVHVAPVAIKSPHSAQSYSSVSIAHSSAPVAHYAAPVAQYAAPVAHYAAPVAHYAAPVAHYSAPLAVAQPLVHAAPVLIKSAMHHGEEHAPAKYEFAYGVEDHHTGDIHSHKEARDGDLTQGEYSLHEADGTIRTVKYTVDKHSGFNAVVERSGHAVHAQPAKAILAAPIVKSVVAAPLLHHY